MGDRDMQTTRDRIEVLARLTDTLESWTRFGSAMFDAGPSCDDLSQEDMDAVEDGLQNLLRALTPNTTVKREE